MIKDLNLRKAIKKLITDYKLEKNKFINTVNSEKDKKRKIIMQLPNMLTKSRFIAPFVIFFLDIKLQNLSIKKRLAIIISSICLFGLTDFFDGLIARKYNVKSKYGANLDAIADKLFLFGISIPILLTNPLLIISTIIFEFIIGAINVTSKLKDNNPKTIQIGRFKNWLIIANASILYLLMLLCKPLIASLLVTIPTNIIQAITANEYYKIDKQKDFEKERNSKKENTKNHLNNEHITDQQKPILQTVHIQENEQLKDEEEKIFTKTKH